MTDKPDVEVKSGQVTAWFTGSENQVYFTPDEARLWAEALVMAANAADALKALTA